MEQKLWAVVRKIDGEIFDTDSVSFTRRGTQQWKNNEMVKFSDLKKEIQTNYKIVRIEITLI
jgi:hypothetical protein